MSREITKAGGFALQPQNMGEAMEIANMLATSQMVPKQYQNKPQDALVAMMMGGELGLNPIQSLQNIATINGKPSIYGDALLALVQNHPCFGGHEESFDEQTMTATCTVWRRGEDKVHTQTFSQADAQKAGLWGKSGPWTQYPKRMLMWRARGYALRDKFSDALGGLITVEEAQDIPGERDITPRREPAKQCLPEQYPDEKFNTNFETWKGLILTGKKSPEQILATLESRAALSDVQRQKILAIGNEEAAA